MKQNIYKKKEEKNIPPTPGATQFDHFLSSAVGSYAFTSMIVCVGYCEADDFL